MKQILLGLAVLGSVVLTGSAFAGTCVNTSGNAAYDQMCATMGNMGECSDYPNICTEVSRCVNVSGNPAYNSLCASAGTFGQCADYPNICIMN